MPTGPASWRPTLRGKKTADAEPSGTRASTTRDDNTALGTDVLSTHWPDEPPMMLAPTTDVPREENRVGLGVDQVSGQTHAGR